jgi:pimeloyl-ACP methyl ester carboxylesterase
VRGTGPALVFVHGTPFSSHVWHRVANQDVSLGIQNVVLSEMLEHWGLTRPDVVAHDFGGATAPSGAGHLVQEDAPEAVVAALLGFLGNGG